MGRPTRLNDALQEKICQFLRAGNYFSVACSCSGISPNVGNEWLGRGRGVGIRPKTDLYAAFAQAIEKATDEAQAQAVMLIRKAAIEGQWTAAAWFLERKFHDQWARRDRSEVTGKDGAAIQVEHGVTPAVSEYLVSLRAWRGATDPHKGDVVQDGTVNTDLAGG